MTQKVSPLSCFWTPRTTVNVVNDMTSFKASRILSSVELVNNQRVAVWCRIKCTPLNSKKRNTDACFFYLILNYKFFLSVILEEDLSQPYNRDESESEDIYFFKCIISNLITGPKSNVLKKLIKKR